MNGIYTKYQKTYWKQVQEVLRTVKFGDGNVERNNFTIAAGERCGTHSYGMEAFSFW